MTETDTMQWIGILLLILFAILHSRNSEEK